MIQRFCGGKDTGDKLSLLEVVPPLLPGQPRIGIETKRRRNARYKNAKIMLK